MSFARRITVTAPSSLSPAAPGTGSFPRDLRERLGECELAHAVINAAAGSGCRHSGWREADQAYGLPKAMMLSLLSYAYAAGIYSSAEVECHTRSDAMARYLCANHHPSADELRRFRRKNRLALEDALARCFHVWSEKAQHAVTYATVAGQMMQSVSTQTDVPSRCLREAQARIDRAVRADSMALDD